ncbi:MAG: NUDIX hydrolase [Bacteriovoracaceae bacterium]
MLKKTKVLAYIHRDCNGINEVLVFDHVDSPEAGTQVIGGTVEDGEDLREALLREIIEESGLVFHIVDVHPVAQSTYHRKDITEVNFRHYYQIEGSHLEDHWIHTVDSQGEDNNLRFKFYWLDISCAQTQLTGSMGEHLARIQFP